MYAFQCMLEEEFHRKMTETYIAEHLWFATGALYAMTGNELKTPRYTSLIDQQNGKTDIRSAEEIKADILKKLG